MAKILSALCVATCVAVLLLIPSIALAPVLTVADLVQWTGCHVQVIEDSESTVLGSFFGFDLFTGEPAVVIGTRSAPEIPEYVKTIILFHESGHCLQWQEGTLLLLGDGSRHDSELDADRRAADLACDYHLDGRRLLHDTFVWAHAVLRYDGDPNHGTVDERIHQGDLATHCDRPQQAA